MQKRSKRFDNGEIEECNLKSCFKNFHEKEKIQMSERYVRVRTTPINRGQRCPNIYQIPESAPQDDFSTAYTTTASDHCS